MEKHPPSPPSPLVHFEIDASRCDLRVGDVVSPNTEIGTDSATGRRVLAGCHGTVVGVVFNGGRHTLAVTVQKSVRDPVG